MKPILRRAALKLRGAGLPVDAEAVAAGQGGLLASGGGDGAVRIWENVLTRKGRDGL